MRLLGVCALLLASCVTSPSVIAEDKKSEAIKVSAKDLVTAYKGTEGEKDPKKKYKEADDKYKGKVLELTGVMTNVIGATSPYFIVEGGTGARVRVYCAFGNEYKEGLQTLRKSKKLKAGVTVTVRGTCSGLKGKDVRLDDCVLIDPPLEK